MAPLLPFSSVNSVTYKYSTEFPLIGLTLSSEISAAQSAIGADTIFLPGDIALRHIIGNIIIANTINPVYILIALHGFATGAVYMHDRCNPAPTYWIGKARIINHFSDQQLSPAILIRFLSVSFQQIIIGSGT